MNNNSDEQSQQPLPEHEELLLPAHAQASHDTPPQWTADLPPVVDTSDNQPDEEHRGLENYYQKPLATPAANFAHTSVPKPKTTAEQLLAMHHGNLESAMAALRQAAGHSSPSDSPQTAEAQVSLTNTNAQPRSDKVVISVKDAVKRYKVGRTKVDALKGVNLNIYEGEFIAITGTSGSGKSTLLQMMGGLDRLNSGEIDVLGQNIAKLRDGKLSKFRNQTIGFVFQFFYLQPFLTLQTNVEVPAMFARKKPRDRSIHSRELIDIVGLGERRRHLPRELSGGQLQRAAIARALQNKPKILLADEPTGNLDRTNALAIFDLFKKIRDEQGTTVVVVTHDLELANMADRSIRMSDGVVV